MKDSSLTIGWQTTQTDDPRYWLRPDAKPGQQSDEELVMVPAEALATHTVVVAQSGSGKSAFVGRLVEEILLRTKARCLILDPNSDFRQAHSVESGDLWRRAKFNTVSRDGRLPAEASKGEFEEAWSKIEKKISVGGQLPSEVEQPYEQLKLWWPSLSVEFLSEDLDPMKRGELYHCHAFTQAVAQAARLRNGRGRSSLRPIEVAEEILRKARQKISGVADDVRKNVIQDVFLNTLQIDEDSVAWNRVRAPELRARPGMSRQPSRSYRRFLAQRQIAAGIERAEVALNYVSEDVARFYFGRAREISAAGILSTREPPPRGSRERLHVVDLPSIGDIRTRLLAINAILEMEWQQARADWERALAEPPSEDDRVPTFIVIDEAHNLIPAGDLRTPEAALRDQFRTIVAEGRKYGLFLVLVTQRPDKLDPIVLSECENKAVMRLDSQFILDSARDMLGLGDVLPRSLEKTLGFGVGRALLIGRWAAEGPRVVYCAARRTVEGGRNLRLAHWAVSARVPAGNGTGGSTKSRSTAKKARANKNAKPNTKAKAKKK